MNTHLNATRILCFGDSNTWGRDPRQTDERYPVTVRWTGLLQTKLGERFEVIEEGLQARTTNLDDPNKAGRNGSTYLLPCLLTHNPFEVMVMMLGTNDMKEKFHRTPTEITNALQTLVQTIKTTALNQHGTCPHILLVVPPRARAEFFKSDTQFTGAEEKSKELEPLLEQLAQTEMIQVITLSQYAQTGETDGVHLEEVDHSATAAVVYEKIMALCR